MSSIVSTILDDQICQRLTTTLLHFVWQGTAIGVLTFFTVWLLRTADARVRYLIHAVSLGLMALCVLPRRRSPWWAIRRRS